MGTAAKILSRERLLALRDKARRDGRALVQCHGCFDIVHPGHVRHLRQARGYGDLLLVSITGDGSFTKRNGQPLIPEELRAEALAELDCVDWVYIEPRPTAADLLAEVRPDVYVKGREYESNADPRFQAERQTVEKHGGRVVFSSGDVVFSSSALIAALESAADPYHARLRQLLARPELDGAGLCTLAAGFRGKRVLVVGETIIDQYVLCDQPEVASESPVMTLRPLERRTYDGGAAVIARHVAALGGSPTLLTALPRSPAGDALRQRLGAEGVETLSVAMDAPLPEKQRFLVGVQKVMKLNNLEPIVIDAARQDEFVALADLAARGTDAAVIADFGNGLFSPALLDRLCPAVRRRAPILTGDVSGRRSALLRLTEMDLLCPSEAELREAYRNFDESIPTVAWRLVRDTKARNLLVTMGAEGLIAFEPLKDAEQPPTPPVPLARPLPETNDGRFLSRLRSEHVPALVGHALDPLGCGDALLAAATMALCAGGTLLQAAFLGAVAAAAQAQRLGNTPVSATDLRRGIVRAHTAQLAFDPAGGGSGIAPFTSTDSARAPVAPGRPALAR
jgi:rfaE bifunctional protein nucleotidyltransferase chain/domain